MSSLPAVLAALAAIGTAALPNSQVINGGETIIRERWLLVGPDSDDQVEIEREFDSMSDVTTSESYVVPLKVSANFSGVDLALADNAVLTDYEAMVQAVLDHPSGHTLGLDASGVINVLPLGTHSFAHMSDGDGRYAVVRFGVQVYAQTT